jgi:hypothetical protein
MTRFTTPFAASLTTVAITLVMPLILNVTPISTGSSATSLPTPVAAQATIGAPPSQLV